MRGTAREAEGLERDPQTALAGCRGAETQRPPGQQRDPAPSGSGPLAWQPNEDSSEDCLPGTVYQLKPVWLLL